MKEKDGRQSSRYMTREEAMAMERRQKIKAGRSRKKRRKALVVVLAVLVLLAVIGGFLFSKLGLIDRVKLSGLKTYRDSGPYTNIVLYGLDSREGELSGGVRSDTIIIASINNETDEVKLVSVYRDTYLMHPDGYFRKANAAYVDGAENSMNMLNENLDLDIQQYVAINFKALVMTIDALGGIELELTAEEAYWTDGYVTETAQVVGTEGTYLPHENGGTYTLNGVQATAYCRVRYTDGNDFRRTERQRLVLSKVLEKAKSASLVTLYKIANEVLPEVSTSLSNTQILGMALHVGGYTLADSTGFPSAYDPDWRDDSGAENVVPAGLCQNVEQLHAYLFPDQTYTASEEVQSIHNKLINITGVYPE